MGFLSFLFPWGVILQGMALVHFIRRRPDNFWLWIIIFFGPPGAVIYLAMEVAPDLSLLRQSFDSFGRRKRIGHLESLVLENPSPGNYEELGDLYLDEKAFTRARECYDKVLARPGDHQDPRYRRAIAAIQLEDFGAAREDLEQVVAREAKYDSHRALALLAYVCAQTGDVERADALFAQATEASTLSETYLNYASFLSAQGRADEARTWAQRIVARRDSMPRYLRRRERAWFRKAKALVKRLPKSGPRPQAQGPSNSAG